MHPETCEDDPYDRGYWSRYQGLPRSNYVYEHYSNWTAFQEGWDDCAVELAAELAESVCVG